MENFTNSSSEYEEYEYDPDESFSTFDMKELVSVSIVYGLTLLLGILGNSLIIFTIAKYSRMRSITNVFLASLASADLLLVLLCVPIKFAKLFSFTWSMGAFLCKFVHYIQNFSAICSVLTLTSMSLERTVERIHKYRYFAILYPIKAKYICTISQARKIIIGIWATSILLATPVIFVQILYPIGPDGPNQKYWWCVPNWNNPTLWRSFELYMLFLLLIFPTAIMGYAYTNICLEVWSVMKQRATMTGTGDIRYGKDFSNREIYPMKKFANKDHNSCQKIKSKSSSRSHDDSVTVKQVRDNKKVIKMLVAVVLLFVICWAPLLINNVLTAFGVLSELNHGYLKPMRTTFNLLAYLNSCINPIVYGFMSRNFRNSFLNVICPCREDRPVRQLSFTQTRTTSISIGRSLSVSNPEKNIANDIGTNGRLTP